MGPVLGQGPVEDAAMGIVLHEPAVEVLLDVRPEAAAFVGAGQWNRQQHRRGNEQASHASPSYRKNGNVTSMLPARVPRLPRNRPSSDGRWYLPETQGRRLTRVRRTDRLR